MKLPSHENHGMITTAHQAINEPHYCKITELKPPQPISSKLEFMIWGGSADGATLD